MERARERTFFRLFLLHWLPVLLYLTVILVLSAQPYLSSPLEFPNSDKLIHILEYFGFGVLLVRALRPTVGIRLPLVAALAALSIGIVVGTGDEYLQSFVPGRSSDPMDLLADTTGVTLAMLVYLAFARE